MRRRQVVFAPDEAHQCGQNDDAVVCGGHSGGCSGVGGRRSRLGSGRCESRSWRFGGEAFDGEQQQSGVEHHAERDDWDEGKGVATMSPMYIQIMY